MFTVNNKEIRTTPMTSWRRSGAFIVNLEHISPLVPSVSIVNFEQVNADWVKNYDPALKMFLSYYLQAIMQWVGGNLITQNMQIHTSVTAYTCITISSPVEKMYGKTQVLGLFFPSPKPTTLFIQQIIFQQIFNT